MQDPYHMRGWLRPATKPFRRHFKWLLGDREYRRLQSLHARFGAWPRFKAGSFEVDGLTVEFTDAASLLNLWDEIFVSKIYDLGELPGPLRVVDAGANLGLTMLYLKRRYGSVSGVCFEPDPAIAEVLRRNLKSWDCGEVAVEECALGAEEGTANFASDGSDGGRVDGNGGLEVAVKRLSPFLEEPTDFLKIDIEGAEFDVLEELVGRLSQVKRLFIELHTFPGQPQRIGRALAILEEAGFRVFPQALIGPHSPFDPQAVGPEGDLEQTLNVFATRVD